VTKKLSKDAPALNGRERQQSRMSRRPGIGAGFVDEIASTLLEYDLEESPDVPAALRHGKKILPLGRYLRRRLREAVGKDPDAPQETLDEIAAEVQELRKVAWENNVSLSATYTEALAGLEASVTARQALTRRKRL